MIRTSNNDVYAEPCRASINMICMEHCTY